MPTSCRTDELPGATKRELLPGLTGVCERRVRAGGVSFSSWAATAWPKLSDGAHGEASPCCLLVFGQRFLYLGLPLPTRPFMLVSPMSPFPLGNFIPSTTSTTLCAQCLNSSVALQFGSQVPPTHPQPGCPAVPQTPRFPRKRHRAIPPWCETLPRLRAPALLPRQASGRKVKVLNPLPPDPHSLCCLLLIGLQKVHKSTPCFWFPSLLCYCKPASACVFQSVLIMATMIFSKHVPHYVIPLVFKTLHGFVLPIRWSPNTNMPTQVFPNPHRSLVPLLTHGSPAPGGGMAFPHIQILACVIHRMCSLHLSFYRSSHSICYYHICEGFHGPRPLSGLHTVQPDLVAMRNAM